MVYALGETAQSATTTSSLVLVGITAAAAAVGHARAGRVRWRHAGLAFGAAEVAASLVGTHLDARVQPDVLLIAFALLVLIAAAAMLVKTLATTTPDEPGDDEQAEALRGPTATAERAVCSATRSWATGFVAIDCALSTWARPEARPVLVNASGRTASRMAPSMEGL